MLKIEMTVEDFSNYLMSLQDCSNYDHMSDNGIDEVALHETILNTIELFKTATPVES